MTNLTFLPNSSAGFATAAPIVIDVPTALRSGASYLSVARQAIAAASGAPRAFESLGDSASPISSLVAQFDVVAAELGARMVECAALFDGIVHSAKILEEYRERLPEDSSDENSAAA